MIADRLADGVLLNLVGGLVVQRGQREAAAITLRHLGQRGGWGGRRGRRVAGADFCRNGERKRREGGAKGEGFITMEGAAG
ncbi:MAG: hypothetical protein IPI44_08815 [Sulfuritalea sp.]|nr:hypothetical protein [Sulfuritalea sp.]